MTTTALPLTDVLARRLNGRPLVLLLDIDGTLAPIAPRPGDAVVPRATLDVLQQLAAAPQVSVVAVSGRAVDDARRMIPIDRLWVIGNHGVEFGEPNRTASVRPDVALYASAVAIAADRVARAIGPIEGVVIENKRWTLSVHYRLVDRAVVPEILATTGGIARDLGLRLSDGKEVLEIRPPLDVNKGTASIEIGNRLHAFSTGASVLCAGDDRTDEDMFRSIRARDANAVTVRVVDQSDDTGATTSTQTSAEFTLRDTDAVRELLRATLELRSRRDDAG